MGVELLFVYGTLRRGGANAMHLLHPGSVFVGNAGVRGRLYDMGGYPALVLDDEAGSVAGEVYEIDAEIMQGLDEFEAAAQYARRRVAVMLKGAETSCWLYGPEEDLCSGKDLISSGDWIEHVKAIQLLGQNRTE